MKKRMTALLLSVALCLTAGCASLLDKESITITAHDSAPEAEGTSSALRVENYQEMVNALLYLVTVGEETGTLRLYNYDRDRAKEELTAACLEVSQEDPLGAYSVSYIQYELSTIVSYDQADIQITYSRTREDVESIVNAVGTTSIRRAFAQAMEGFQSQVVVQISYFDGGVTELEELLRRAYYEIPASALGMPTATIELYPRTGTRRIAEVTLEYPTSAGERHIQQLYMNKATDEILAEQTGDTVDGSALIYLAQSIMELGGLQEEGDTAYYALVAGGATSEGLALAMDLLVEESDIYCMVVEGTLNGESHYWNVLMTPWGYRHLDISTYDALAWAADEVTSPFLSDLQAMEQGYIWDGDWVPLCGDQPAEGRDGLTLD